jgi:hypothetical protein
MCGKPYDPFRDDGSEGDMKALGAVLAVTVGAAVAGAETVALPLAWRLVVPVPPAVVTQAEQEVVAVFQKAGLSVTWTSPDDDLSDGVLPVVVLSSPRSAALPPHLLGISSPDRGAGVWIFYSTIRAELGFRRSREESVGPREARSLGRALGRVVAHEVVHAYQIRHEHARVGLMGPHFDARALTGDDLAWDSASQAALVRAVRDGGRALLDERQDRAGTAVLAQRAFDANAPAVEVSLE